MSENTFLEHQRSAESWYCMTCLAIKSNNIRWGEMEGEETIKQCISAVYADITSWHKNIFMVPRGKAGTEFIVELTRLLALFNDDTKWSRVAISLMHVFIPLMLQRPSKKSKAKDNAKYLASRLQLWRNGNLEALCKEGNEIQLKLQQTIQKKKENKDKAFCRLMLLGKVGPAMKFIDNEDPTVGVHPITAEIKTLLEEKHPKGEEACAEVLLPETAVDPHPVVFEEIDAEKVQKAAMKLHGSGGPTLLDADGWRHILCSKSYGKASINLCQVIADFAKKLCRERIPSESLTEYVASCLIPLDKGADRWGNPGVRPIGVGEILKRLVGKVVVENIRDDIIEAAGPLQTCAGLKAGVEGTIHAMKKIFDEEETEAMLLVDADNAFNRLNRKAALHNIKQLCPKLHLYLENTYQAPAQLFINDNQGQDSIFSDEGSTQGDVPAMAMYAIATKPLLDTLHGAVNKDKCKQAWYADDSSSAGKLQELRKWWDKLNASGPKYGYHPKATKTYLIIKDPELLDLATEAFRDTDVVITEEGEKHLGAVVGTPNFREQYVKDKVDKWVDDIKQLAKIGKDEPQLALTGYTKSLCKRWSYLQRTVSDIKELFQPIEDTICEKLIPAIVGRKVSSLERRILALPVRYGGIGLQNPVETADLEYETSVTTTAEHTKVIYNQETTFDNLDDTKVQKSIEKMKQKKENNLKRELESIKSEVDEGMKRCLVCAQEKGSGSWLVALPIESLGYVLNKQEFRDSLCLRYGWKIPKTPLYCSCGQKNSVDHSLSCKSGGYVSMRHDRVRDLEAGLLKEVCKDVRIEPDLLPIGNTTFDHASASTEDGARLDVSAVGIYSPMERTFLDVRVTHPNCPSYKDLSLSQLYNQQEKEKKRKYNQRIVQVEKATFTPLVFTTTGGMAPECVQYHKRLASLIAKKTKEEYPKVMNHIRTRTRFAILKSTLIAIRGERGKKDRPTAKVTDLSFNTIPEMPSYEP